MRTASLFEAERLTLEDSLELTAASLREYGPGHADWYVAFSGGKDSTATLTATVHLLESGQVPAPRSLTALYADTRMELPPLQAAALDMLAALEGRGVAHRIVEPVMDRRFFVYILGRGVPPSHSGFRWCTGGLKVDPMAAAMRTIRAEQGSTKPLLITGMRLGESAARDQRIALACGKNGGECGQGWYQETTPAEVADTLAPLLHWRVCHIGDWLTLFAPSYGFATAAVAEAYGAGVGDTEPLEARTGCMVCPVAARDLVLERLIAQPKWAYLAPLLRLRAVYEELGRAPRRIRKDGERLASGAYSSRPMRLGPLTLEARRWGLQRVLEVQDEVQRGAAKQDRPTVWLIRPDEQARIEELIAAEVWPAGWDGTEAAGDALLPMVAANGAVQDALWTEVA